MQSKESSKDVDIFFQGILEDVGGWLEYCRDTGVTHLNYRHRAGSARRKLLDQIRADMGDCRLCRLYESRKQIVFGSGNAKAELMFVGEAPEQLQFSLARQELQRVFDEGHDVGILRPVQRRLAQGMMSLANAPLAHYCVPVSRPASVHLGSDRAEVLRIAARNQSPCLLVTEARGRRILGYVRISEMRYDESDTLDQYRQLIEISANESPVTRTVPPPRTKSCTLRNVSSAMWLTFGTSSIR